MVTAMKTNIGPQPVHDWRWCKWCGHMTKYGWHNEYTGRFEYKSVMVPESEVIKAKIHAIRTGAVNRPVELIRRNIALGYHSGARG